MKYLFLAIGIASLFSFLAPAAEARLDTQGLLQLIDQHDIKTIEDLIKNLPAENRAHYALIYHSLSPQHGSLAEPRVIDFDEEGDFLLAFNGDASQEFPHHTLDILDYRPDTGTYEGHAMHFDPEGKARPILERNAPLCLQCHNAFLGVEPVRRAYLGTVFPGIFGSMGDAFSSPVESAAFQEFLKSESHQGRYQYLAAPPVTKDGSARSDSPNTLVGYLLNRKGYVGLAKYLASRKELQPYRYAILAGLECTGAKKPAWDSKIEDYLPKAISAGVSWADVQSQSIAARKKEMQGALTLRDYYLGESHASGISIPLTPDESETAPALKYLLMQAGTYSKSTDKRLLSEIDQIIADGTDQHGGIRNLAEPLYSLFLNSETDGELYSVHKRYDESRKQKLASFAIADAYGKRICPLLKSKSLAALAESKP